MNSLLAVAFTAYLLGAALSAQAPFYKAGSKVVEETTREYETAEKLCTSASTRYQRFCNGKGGSQCDASGSILCTGIGKGIFIPCDETNPFCVNDSFGYGSATCIPTRPSNCTPAASEFNCFAAGVFPNPTNCQSYINCVSSGKDTFNAEIYDCGTQYVFDPSAPKDFNCRLRNDAKSNCVKVDCSRNPLRNVAMDYPDFPACKGEIIATCLGDKMPLVTRCPEGFKANLALLPPVCEIVCSEEGVFEYPGDETKFYDCSLTYSGWVASLVSCLKGETFNKSTKTCGSSFETTTTEAQTTTTEAQTTSAKTTTTEAQTTSTQTTSTPSSREYPNLPFVFG
jgi:hypothetical protein